MSEAMHCLHRCCDCKYFTDLLIDGEVFESRGVCIWHAAKFGTRFGNRYVNFANPCEEACSKFEGRLGK